MFTFDAALVLGKETRRHPERAVRELRARAAAASAALRAGARFVATLEARLQGQDRSGSELVVEMLRELGVDEGRIVARSVTRSTREEAWLGTSTLSELGAGRGLVLTARYHVPRTRRLFVEAGAAAEVHEPAALWRYANERERAWIHEGEPDEAALEQEAPSEFTFGLLEAALRPLPLRVRTRIEVHAGAWWRGT